ncbi:hypothetical protein SAMN02745912_03765 [Paramaledivibacter caminithermalis DSM 15212]|jgi:hypothetical protein|uniref:Uncharacterized protein n=1 Tax=Paramaledivibacter caminithermalis (strain DSM 15212 / CIP 107654 / DViRD3) TaxID=1121301 RepID=A0A1M6TQU3_PARC5|nr:hypothetical protein SAMN02745912_03765 [Paramaledivibacter caminithermalis DSM 15212]
MDRKDEWEKEWGWGKIVKNFKIHDDKSLFDGHNNCQKKINFFHFANV